MAALDGGARAFLFSICAFSTFIFYPAGSVLINPPQVSLSLIQVEERGYKSVIRDGTNDEDQQ